MNVRAIWRRWPLVRAIAPVLLAAMALGAGSSGQGAIIHGTGPVPPAFSLGRIVMRTATFGWASFGGTAGSTVGFTTDGGLVWQRLPQPPEGKVFAWVVGAGALWAIASHDDGRDGVLLRASAAPPGWQRIAALPRPPVPGSDVPVWGVWTTARGAVEVSLIVWRPGTPPGARPLKVMWWRLSGHALRGASAPAQGLPPLVAYAVTRWGALRASPDGTAALSVTDNLGLTWRRVTLRWTPVGSLAAYVTQPLPLPGSPGVYLMPIVLWNRGVIVGWPGHLVASVAEVARGSATAGRWSPVVPPVHLPVATADVRVVPQSALVWWLSAIGPSVAHPRSTDNILLRTMDGGRTWHAAKLPAPADEPGEFAFAGSRGWLVAGAYGTFATYLFGTADDGRTWHRIAYRVEAVAAK